MHGLNSRKPLEGQSYGTGYGGRVLARRGKSGRRKAPPRPRPTVQSPPPGFPIPQPSPESTSSKPQPTVDVPALPVQKQYGEIETPAETTTPIPEVVEKVEEIKIPEETSDDNPSVVSDELTVQDGAERRSLGLTSREVIEDEPVEIEESDEERTSALLQKSKSSAQDAGYVVSVDNTMLTKPVAEEEKKTRVIRKISKAKKNNQRVEQRATRTRRLDRSRHVEYRYEMRALLKEIEVSPEHHSVILGSIWAKGERQDVNSAKDFVRERMSSGAINEDQCNRLLSLIDAYTTRR